MFICWNYEVWIQSAFIFLRVFSNKVLLVCARLSCRVRIAREPRREGLE